MSVSLQVPLVPVANDVVRPTANFCPNFWGDRFLTYTPDDAVSHERKEQIELLKEEVKKQLKASAPASPELLKLIDSIQRLGLTYHYEREIEEAFKHMYETYSDLVDDDNDELAYASLRFRLLRQEGYPIPSDVFFKFKEEGGKFKEALASDIPGMLALYEATRLMVHGEDILEEALAFTTAHLPSVARDSNNPLSKQVMHVLKRPIRKSLTRVEARHYISLHQQEGSHNKSLLKLAKLDFNLLQSLHRKELSDITRWWKDLDFEKRLPFVRDRLVECYFWALGVFYEPQYFLSLRFLTKVTAILSAMDDIYDAYGTFEELERLTEAVERWDASFIDQLPADYLKWFYRALLDVYEEMEEEMAKEGKLYRVYYAKQLIKRQFQAYFVEAKWLNQRYTPTFDEYMTNAQISCGYALLIGTSFVGLGDMVNEECFQWVLNHPKMIKATENICRLMDDIVSHEFEQTRMHLPSSVECYMKQYGVTEQEACDELNKQIVMSWKDINQECLRPTPVPMLLLTCVLNFSRVMDVLYKEADEYTLVGKRMKDLVALMFIDSIPI